MLYFLLTLLLMSPKEAKWFEVSSDHFLLYTDTSEMKGRRLLSDLENRVDAFSQAFGRVPPRQFPIEVFLFKEDQDFYEALPPVKSDPNIVTVQQRRPAGPFGLPLPGGGGIPGGTGGPTGTGGTGVPTDPGIPGGGGGGGNIPGLGTPLPDHTPAENQLRKAAYLLRGPDRVFIVARDKSPDAIANDVGHALGHMLFERYVVWRPFWLAEGAAEYVRNIGRAADTKPIPEEDAFSAADMFTIVQSGTYKDDDPPTPFRTESYRLVRLLLDSKPEALKQFIADLHKPSSTAPKFPLAADSLEDPLKGYVEAPLKAASTVPALRSSEADMAKLAVHRGDLLVASARDSEAGRWYNADSKEARAARAILTRYNRPAPEAVRAMDRAARELPDNGLVQYHFGVMDVKDLKDVQAQQAALERAVQLLPLMGRAYAELARVDALTGQQLDKALPLVAKALELEPEYADHFYEIRADVHLALGQTAEALQDVSIATDLPHPDRSVVEGYLAKSADIRKRIEAMRREGDQRDLDQVAKEVRDKVAELEPPPQPAPPPPPVAEGTIRYEIETRAPIEVVDAVYPDYPEALRAKHAAGTIAFRVDIGPDGKVKTASVASSQLPDLNRDTLDAVKKWVFKPGNRSIRLVLTFSLQ